MMFISVVLPEPDGPNTSDNSATYADNSTRTESVSITGVIANAKSRRRRFKPAAEHAFYYFNPR